MPAPNVPQIYDAYGHEPQASGPLLTAGAVSTTAVGTIAPTTGAGAAPTVTLPTATDLGGQFVLSPVTGGGAQAAGAVAIVTFANSLPALPRTIVCTIYDQANGAAVAAMATLITATSFSFSVGVALTTAHVYTCAFMVQM